MKVEFLHPLYSDRKLILSLSPEISFDEIEAMLIKQGFIEKKRGGYHFLIDDRLCTRKKPLLSYFDEPAPEVLEVRIHGLLTILI